MDNILEIDINEIISKKYTKRLKDVEEDLSSAYAKINQQQIELGKLKKSLMLTDELSGLLEVLQESFGSIKADKPDSGGWYDSKQKKQYQFIVKLMKMIYGIDNKLQWLNSRGDGRLKTYLAVAYYDHKDQIMQLIKVLSPEYAEINNFIASYVMPRDYSKDEVTSYASKPHYCTNGAIYGISQFWMERGAGKDNLPHDLIMVNHHIVSDDVFLIMLDTIKNKKANYYNLFAVWEYNENITDEQIALLGECLIDNLKLLTKDRINKFVRYNMEKFTVATLDYFYEHATKDNQYQVLHWENFPAEYQRRYISSKSAEDALKLVTSCNCKLSPNDKISLLCGAQS